MNNTWYKALVGSAGIAGVIYFLVQSNILIIAPYHSVYTAPQETATKKNIALFFYTNRWQQETVPLLIPKNDTHRFSTLVHSWLTVGNQEEFLSCKITLEHAFITKDRVGYLLFDQQLFNTRMSIREKLSLLYGLLRTIHTAQVPVTSIYFLVNNIPMIDDHLDFTVPWVVDQHHLD